MDKRYLLSMALIAGCKLDLRDGDLLCNHNGKACPDGYHCAGDDRCYLNGHEPDLSAEADNDLSVAPDLSSSGIDAAGDDLTQEPDLTHVKAQSDPCVAGVDVCSTGHCVDGYCCDSDCTDACAACDVSGSLGTCSAVTGPTHGSRSCNGTGTCSGKCTGGATSCSYPSPSVICGSACDGHCDGAGGCSVGTGGSCPNGFACGTNACLTSCSNDNDCQQPNFKCQSPNCIRVPESDCLDGLDNNGDGKIDCDDPTCTTVACVTSPGVGNEFGFFPSSSCPAQGYVTETVNQNLSTPSCTGCSCATPTLTCYLNGKLYYSSGGTCNTSSYENISAPTGGTDTSAAGTCTTVTTRTYYAYQHSASTYSANCSPTGTATLPDPSFGVTKSFCASSRFSANNCNGDSTKICVAKPASGIPLCARVPGVAVCPPGYGGGSSATYYNTWTKGSCGSCSGCGVGSVQCGTGGLYFFSVSDCNSAYEGISYGDTGCHSTWVAAGAHQLPTTLNAYRYLNPLGTPTGTVSCTPPSVTTSYSTPAAPSTICCQP